MDTLVEGSPPAVTSAATWLRDTLATKLADSGDEQQDARASARSSWEGETASSYQNFAADLLKATDKHEERVKRAATALDQYAARLQRCIDDMADIRSRARAGDLTVSGTVIHQPPDAPAGTFDEGSDEEAAHRSAVARIELWNILVEDTTTAYQEFVDWVDAQLHARRRGRQGEGRLRHPPRRAGGHPAQLRRRAGAGLASLVLLDRSRTYKAAATEFRRKSRVSGDPGIRGSADTPSGRARLDDLLGKAEWLKKGGRLLGPAGILIDVGFGIYEGAETGDWTRVALTTGTSIAVGVGVTALVAAGVITAPAWGVVLAGGALAAGAAWGVGQIYDNWDDITDTVSDTWDDATDAVGDAWDSVTPW